MGGSVFVCEQRKYIGKRGLLQQNYSLIFFSQKHLKPLTLLFGGKSKVNRGLVSLRNLFYKGFLRL